MNIPQEEYAFLHYLKHRSCGVPFGKRGLTETDMGDRFVNANLL